MYNFAQIFWSLLFNLILESRETDKTIDSKVAKQNQILSGQFEQAVVGASEKVIIPKGSAAEIVIRQTSAGGVAGSPDMMLDVQAITVTGRRYVVSTADLQQKSDTGIGMNKRTAEMMGGGAALGTILGAVAGGQGRGHRSPCRYCGRRRRTDASQG